MIYGIIGLNMRDFNTFCQNRNLKRIDNYTYRDIVDNEYVYLDNNPNHIIGRQFEKILDLDPIRLDLIRRLPKKDNYIIGFE